MTESYIHADYKTDLYWDIFSDEEYVEVEKKIGHTRTDVLTEVCGHLLAIEVQYTAIPIKSILRRMMEHTIAGAHTLWLIAPEAFQNGQRIRSLNWVFFIQAIQGGMIFLPGEAKTVVPARIDNSLIFKDFSLGVGSKILDQQNPIEFEQLKFNKNSMLNLNTVTYDEWWVDAYLDCLP